MGKLGSALTLSGTGYFVKAFRTLGLRQFTVEGQDILLNALKEPEQGGPTVDVPARSDKGKARALDYPVVGEEQENKETTRKRRGIVTVCNHNSVFDDPLMWSMTPTSSLFPFASPRHTSRNSRWTLGASDIMFTNPVFSRFFAAGQVIETIRGGGVFQPAIDKAVKLLQDGEWIHIFPEGKVNQHAMNPPGGLFRFKWGVGRIVMDSEVMPDIIPMWISGFDQVMNEYRGFPRPIPRPGGRVSVTIGESISDKIQPMVQRWRAIAAKERGDLGVGGEWRDSVTSSSTSTSGSVTDAERAEDQRQREVRSKGLLAGSQEEAVRIEITAAIQEEVRKLGERVETQEGRFERGDWSHSRRSA